MPLSVVRVAHSQTDYEAPRHADMALDASDLKCAIGDIRQSTEQGKTSVADIR